MTKATCPSQPPHSGPQNEMNWLRRMVRGILAILGLLLILVGLVIGMATPGSPFGLPIGVFGVFLLGTNSLWGRNWMESVLRRFPWIEWMAPHWLMNQVFKREKRPLEVLNPKRAAKLKAKEEARRKAEEATGETS